MIGIIVIIIIMIGIIGWRIASSPAFWFSLRHSLLLLFLSGRPILLPVCPLMQFFIIEISWRACQLIFSDRISHLCSSSSSRYHDEHANLHSLIGYHSIIFWYYRYKGPLEETLWRVITSPTAMILRKTLSNAGKIPIIVRGWLIQMA